MGQKAPTQLVSGLLGRISHRLTKEPNNRREGQSEREKKDENRPIQRASIRVNHKVVCL